MSPNDALSITVHIAFGEMLVALGIESALRGHPGIVPRIVVPDEALAERVTGGVVITDYRTGVQFARTCSGRVYSLHRPGPRVLVMSGRDREHEVRFALEAGVHGYLPVSCPPAELVDAVLALSRGMRHLGANVAARIADSLGRKPLTLREHEVLARLASGECNKSIAIRLDIATGTVKSHVKSILHKLGASNRTKAVCIATENGLIEVAGFLAAGETATS